ncbi:hypothetical protein C8J57DRAFT_1651328 [Mycena rebaudengoi]|nr:hypothetical protein C8J57DRAFT_1651328 [Mycena rebaudengoi]
MNSPILPAFPPELEREIFEIGAIEIPQSMPQLVRVARRVCVIEPLLYHTLIVTAPWSNTLSLAIEKHPAKFAKYLRNFLAWEKNYADKEWPLRTLSLCSGIRNLTLVFPVSEMTPALEAMQFRRLSVVLLDLVKGSPVDPARPLFRTLTHVDLWDSDTEFLTGLPFAQFPALTHLSVNHLDAEYSPFLTSTLRLCTRLCVLINMQTSPFKPGNETDYSVDDLRFVLMRLSNDQYAVDWKVGVDGGKDLWVHAELFVAKRKREEIQPASRYWIEDTDFSD